MSRQRIDLTGQRFGAWMVIVYVGGVGSCWVCWCDCGTIRTLAGGQLRYGTSRSCGCQRNDAISEARTSHGHSKTRMSGRVSITYQAWMSLRHFNNGIRPERWETFALFLEDMGERPSALFFLRRKDKTLPFSKENCEWREHSARDTLHEIMRRLALSPLGKP